MGCPDTRVLDSRPRDGNRHLQLDKAMNGARAEQKKGILGDRYTEYKK